MWFITYDFVYITIIGKYLRFVQCRYMTEERIKASELRTERVKAVIGSVLAILFFVGCVVFYATDGFGIRVAQPKEDVASYSAAELYAIGFYITASRSDSEAVSVAEKYHIVSLDSSGQDQAVRKQAQDTINARITELKQN